MSRYDGRHCVVPDLCCCKFVRFESVSINGKRDVRVCMTEALSNRGDWHTATQEFTGVRVPEGMKTHALNSRLLHYFDHTSADAIGTVVLAFWTTEHQLIVLIVRSK